MKTLENFSKTRTIGLSVYRVVLAFLVIKNIIFYFPMAAELFGPAAIFPLRDYLTLTKVYGISALAFPFATVLQAKLYLAFTGIFALMFLFGIYKRATGVILFFMLVILKLRNGFILDGSDNVIQVTLPFLILAESYEYFTYRWKTIQAPWLKKPVFTILGQTVRSLATVGLLVQVCMIYFFTALAKLQGDLWLNGTAIYYTMRVDEFRATDWNIWLTRNHYFVVLGTYFTILWEISFPFLSWFKAARIPVLAMGELLHVGIWLFMRIDNFSWIMIGTYFVFVSNAEYAAFAKWLREKLPVERILDFSDKWRFTRVKLKLFSKKDDNLK